jgi:CubicO group peptidase (beta-lactamase class C family)
MGRWQARVPQAATSMSLSGPHGIGTCLGARTRIIRDGKLLRATGFGFANLAQQRPMRAETLINVGSVTKTATCIVVMQLWERKKFGLDDDVNVHLSFPVRNFAYPDFPVTFRLLLTHTSAITDGPAYEKS